MGAAAKIGSAIYAWADNLFECTDMWLCALIPGGLPKETISLRAARARQQGRAWGCVLCRWLSLSTRSHHCENVLRGVAVSGFAAISAAIQIGALWFLVDYRVLPDVVRAIGGF